MAQKGSRYTDDAIWTGAVSPLDASCRLLLFGIQDENIPFSRL